MFVRGTVLRRTVLLGTALRENLFRELSVWEKCVGVTSIEEMSIPEQPFKNMHVVKKAVRNFGDLTVMEMKEATKIL